MLHHTSGNLIWNYTPMSRNPIEKIIDYDKAKTWRASLARQKKTLVITNGCFDLLHRGHIHYLYLARQLGDTLWVGLNSDASIKTLKGSHRPIFKEEDRAYILASLESVDAVLLFSEPTATSFLSRTKPDIYVKGGDYTTASLNKEEYNLLNATGCEIRFINFVKGHSTTNIINKIKKG